MNQATKQELSPVDRAVSRMREARLPMDFVYQCAYLAGRFPAIGMMMAHWLECEGDTGEQEEALAALHKMMEDVISGTADRESVRLDAFNDWDEAHGKEARRKEGFETGSKHLKKLLASRREQY